MTNPTILITGANGQIGTVLADALRGKYGYESVVVSDIRHSDKPTERFEVLNVLDRDGLEKIVQKHQITEIYHLAAILSAKGEQNPQDAWDINMTGLFNVLHIARQYRLKVFFPSSIAVFGSKTPRQNTPQFTVLEPETVYGISKAAGENWCQYYFEKFGVDIRSVRYPGIIGYQSLPGGGTTDYAVDIFHKAIKGEHFECFLEADTRLPMLYMDDAIRATLEIMDAPAESIKIRTSYNLSGTDFTPQEVAAAIKRHIPEFSISYQPDFRQAIAASWPDSIDDSHARNDWGWQPHFGLEEMTADMISHLCEYYKAYFVH
ncbi:MAG TPA: NAD-dependent epimerase/dehydratase family protein [Saprospiraceae bacterium]|nr:NAD-dependent epimerase/dehydratase family protein [Saprospiraceae bacterium]HMQ84948.1 NAD-dependent epimerase/dehydratase family protein [Saprospiraceae bacterium]